MSGEDKQRIADEIKLLNKLDQTHIIELIKVWHNQQKEEFIMITELMSCSLKEYLRQHKENLCMVVVKKWAKSILEGLYYLHSLNPPVIHRDLKCDNIFISASSGTIKLGDLGFSTELINSYKQSQVGTAYFMAPEMFEEDYEMGVDIYSFGMCMLEICTHSTPYSECKNYGAIYKKKVSTGQKPLAFYRIVNRKLKDFIEACIGPKQTRPKANELLMHEFFSSPDTPDSYKPIEILDEADVQIQKGPVVREIVSVSAERNQKDESILDIELVVKDQDNEQNLVQFQFYTHEEVPEQLVEELSGQMQLTSESIPLLLQAIESKLTERKIVTISIIVAIENDLFTEKKSIEIDFDLDADSPLEVASELVNEMQLDVNERFNIALLIEQKIRGLKHNK